MVLVSYRGASTILCTPSNHWLPSARAGFTKTVGLETALEEQVTCNAICPGYVLTDLIRNQLEDTARARGIPKAGLFAHLTWPVPFKC